MSKEITSAAIDGKPHVSSSAVEINNCPEFPFFGATYPDARCIDGFLWDLDKCDEKGFYSSGDNPPCPFCNRSSFVDYFTDLSDKEVEEMKTDDSLSDKDREDILADNRTKADAEAWAKAINDKYR